MITTRGLYRAEASYPSYATPVGSSRWSPDNPYATRIAKRLASHGGKHAPSTITTDRSIQREQYAVDLARETAELAGMVEVPF